MKQVRSKISYILQYIWITILLGFLWPKSDVKNREEDLARLYKAKDQIEINEENKINKKYNNKSSNENHYDRDSEKSFI
jgi:hypothetical protein|tara:strand:+ start:656 stop:892 length:237 start_codon:yes stop_codon:yes gene_type:complete